MIKVLFFIKNSKVKLTGESPIYARLTLNQETMVFSTGKNILQEGWETTNKLRGNLRLEKEKVLKQSLEAFQLKVEQIYFTLLKSNPKSSLIEVKNVLKGNNLGSKSFLLDIFKKHNEDIAKKFLINEKSKASLQKYKRSQDLIKAFIKKKYGKDDIEIEKVNNAFIYNLESYLKYESQYKDKVGIKNNSVVKYFKNFKTVCNYAIKMELIEKNPFAKYDGKLKIKEAVFLTQYELNTIESLNLTNTRLDRVRDIFLFSCYTGYAPVDACKLTEENIILDNDNNAWIKTERTKTKIKANVPLLPATQKIIDKYAGKQVTLLPKLSNQKMNAYLKEIADLCDLKKNLTWYVSRHTFATTVTLGNGMRIENVSAMMGHSSIKQTQHYAKILDSSVMHDMQKLMSKFK